MFRLTGRTFRYRNVENEQSTFIGALDYDADEVAGITGAAYDSDDDDNFFVTYLDGRWMLYTNVAEESGESATYEVPICIEYVDAGGSTEVSTETFTIYGISDARLNEPAIRYVSGIASRVGSNVEVTVYGKYLDSSMRIFLMNGDHCAMVPGDETWIEHMSDDGTDDRMSFVMGPEYAVTEGAGDELCAIYDLGIGIGDCGANYMMATTSLIRYRYDERDSDAGKIASAGSARSTNKPCFYISEISLRYDTPVPGSGDMTGVGAGGKYGDTMYVRLGPGQDCHEMRYIQVKLKYNRRLDRLRGEQYLDGVQLVENDIVWLAAQMDETEGLWVVQQGDWLGLETVLSTEEAYVNYEKPCTGPAQVPLAVDYRVLPDLGAGVVDRVSLVCAADVPVKYGSQYVCGAMRSPGDILLLDNQVDGNNGIWEVTCTDWVYRGPADSHDGQTVDGSREIITQNDIDFCKCGTYHIWYYYLNAGCYLATAVRTVKVICAGASIVPNNNVVITDYSIRTGTDGDLVANVTGTAGDPVQEDCVRGYDDATADNGAYNSANGVAVSETAVGCGDDSPVLRAPNCMYICDCPRYYTVAFGDSYGNSKESNGFTLLFWQHGYDGWHLYAYIGAGNNTNGMNYYVYHLHCPGVATVDKVDVNADIEWRERNADGIDSMARTYDAWFVEHGGVLADGFGIVDDSWNFYEVDEYGDRVMRYKHILDADTLYQPWSLKCTSLILASRDYLEAPTRNNRRTTCADMADYAKEVECGQYIHGMEHIYGFRYFKSVLSPERFCDIYNDYTCVIGDTWSALSTDDYVDEDSGRRVRAVIVTDQCYDADGNECDCADDGAMHGIIEV